MKRIFTLSAILFLFLISIAEAQPVLIKEIPQGSTNFHTIGNLVYFTSGDSLWRTDGTAGGTVFLKKDFDGFGSFTEFNGMLYFLSDSGNEFNSIFKELWRSNGTSSGTIKLKTSSGFNIKILPPVGSNLYFSASDAGMGVELFKTNGTVAGTILVKDINPGSGNGFLGSSAVVGSSLYFKANDGVHGAELWKTDGTSAGTVLVKDINTGVGNGFVGESVFVFNNQFYFTGFTTSNGREPWKSNGTSTGTLLLKDIQPGSGGSQSIEYKIDYNNSLYFMVYPISTGENSGPADLWKTNGTMVATSKIKTIGEYSDFDYFYNHFRIYNGKIYFFAKQYELDDFLWVTDGTIAGTESIYNILDEFGMVNFFEEVNGYLLFYSINQGIPTCFFRSDGTTQGTGCFTRFKATEFEVFPRDVTKVGDLVFYGDHDGPSSAGSPNNPNDYYQLIQTNGFAVQSVRKIFGGDFLGTDNITDFNGKVLFSTYDDRRGASDAKKRLWIYDPNKPAANVPYFTLVDSDTDKDIQWLKQGDTIYKKPGQNLNIRYNYVSKPGSVVFKMADTITRVENVAPFALGGDASGDYAPWEEGLEGAHRLTAIPYSSSGGNGTAGTELTVSFYIKDVDSGTPPPPPPPPPTSLVFTLVNSDTDSDIRTMKDNDTIIYNSSTDKITIRATPSQSVSYVEFILNGSLYRKEGVAPYALQGDSDGNYNPWPATYGSYTLTAKAHNGSGVVVEEATIHFLVKKAGDDNPPPPPVSDISFTLVDAGNDQDIGPLTDGQTIDLSVTGSNLNIRANSSMTGTKSVVFDFNGITKYKTENAAPYSLFGDNNGNYSSHTFNPGTYTLKATPFSNSGGSGTAGESLSITFHVVNGSSATLAAEVKTYPNPVADKMSVSFTNEETEIADVMIYDQNQREYYKGTHEIQSGEFEMNLDDLSMQRGLYFMKIRTGEKVRVVKILKN